MDVRKGTDRSLWDAADNNGPQIMKRQTWILIVFLLQCNFETAAGPLTDVTNNGDFESPATPRFETFTAPSSFLGWTVASGGVDIVAENFYAPASGLQSLDLNSVVGGSVFQNVTTVPGQVYQLIFSFAANPLPDNPVFPSPAIKEMEVRWNAAALGTFLHDATGHTASNVGWRDYALNVVGTGADRLAFTSLTAGSAGPAIDNVRLLVVPEPPTVLLALVGASMFLRWHR